MTRQFNVGVIGCGEQDPRAWIPTGQKLVTEGFDVVAVADPDRRKAWDFARRLGVPAAYDTLEEMRRNIRVDGLMVCGPADAQAAATIAGLELGLHVFCAEPFGASADDARRMIEAARGADLVLGCGQWRPPQTEMSIIFAPDDRLGTTRLAQVSRRRASAAVLPPDPTASTQPGRTGDAEAARRFLSLVLPALGSPPTAVAAAGWDADGFDFVLMVPCGPGAGGRLTITEVDRGVTQSSQMSWSLQTNWAKACRGEAELLSRPQDAVAVHRVLGAAEVSIQRTGDWIQL